MIILILFIVHNNLIAFEKIFFFEILKFNFIKIFASNRKRSLFTLIQKF